MANRAEFSKPTKRAALKRSGGTCDERDNTEKKMALNLKVGDPVFEYVCDRSELFTNRVELRKRTVGLIRPNGRIILKGSSIQYNQDGRYVGRKCRGEIMIPTAELESQWKLEKARIASEAAVRNLPNEISAQRISADECARIIDAAKALHVVLDEIIAAHNKER